MAKSSDIRSRPINVSLRIIADLSQGIYRSPADALKELVSNAYDAYSETVSIDFSNDFSFLTVRDKGKGMELDDFIEVMETIGASSKRAIDTSNDKFKLISNAVPLKQAEKIAKEIRRTLINYNNLIKNGYLDKEKTKRGNVKNPVKKHKTGNNS